MWLVDGVRYVNVDPSLGEQEVSNLLCPLRMSGVSKFSLMWAEEGELNRPLLGRIPWLRFWSVEARFVEGVRPTTERTMGDAARIASAATSNSGTVVDVWCSGPPTFDPNK